MTLHSHLNQSDQKQDKDSNQIQTIQILKGQLQLQQVQNLDTLTTQENEQGTKEQGPSQYSHQEDKSRGSLTNQADWHNQDQTLMDKHLPQMDPTIMQVTEEQNTLYPTHHHKDIKQHLEKEKLYQETNRYQTCQTHIFFKTVRMYAIPFLLYHINPFVFSL